MVAEFGEDERYLFSAREFDGVDGVARLKAGGVGLRGWRGAGEEGGQESGFATIGGAEDEGLEDGS